MKNAAGEPASVESDGQKENDLAIVSDLAALIERIQERINLIEAMTASAASGGDHNFAANVVVLDDVTPRYAEVLAALTTGNASLRRALRFLADTGASEPGTDGPNENAGRSLRSGRRD